MNLALNHALIDRQVPEYQTAKEADINYSRLSKFIYGLVCPSEDEKQRLSEVLRRPVNELFPMDSEDSNGGSVS